MKVYEYGAMSSKYSCKAENKLTAYVTMCLHFDNQANVLVIYSPKECKKDSWINFNGKILARLDEIFIKNSSMDFDKYIKSHTEEIKACYKTIKRLL